VNVPFTRFLKGDSAKGCLKSPDAILEVLEEEGVDLERPIICSCGSGATAAVLVLGLTLVHSVKRGEQKLVCLPYNDKGYHVSLQYFDKLRPELRE
jgi:hypothetical protein